MARKLRTISSKALCGFAIALVLLASPLPAFADAATTPQQTTSPTDTSSTPTTQPTPSTPPATVVATTPILNLSTTAPTPQTAPTLSTEPNPVSPATSTAAPTTPPPAVVQQSTPSSSFTGQNTVNSAATSGNAAVTDNKKAGDATSGNAQANATVVNVANSTTNFGTGTNFTYFSKDITGDQNGPITIDPTLLSQGSVTGATKPSDFQTASSLTDILNNITLSAKSGDATVSGNKKAGDATTGDASALANVINVVGSTINSQNSFLGVINIYGNLKGDILVPQSFVDSLIDGSNSSANSLSPSASSTTIENNINAAAASGNASVTGNKKAGNATTGDATTSLTVYNLTGQQVVAKNSLLVFVNVLGKWVGMIVQAPGSNTAEFGKDATTSGAQSLSQNTGDTSSTTHITNNISVDATSGNADVTNNKKAGSATSGNAAAGATLVNITNTNFQLGDWFGALFINVLGSWVGDFGIKSDAPSTPATTDPSGQTDGAQQPIQDVKIFRFDSEAPVTATGNDESDQSKSNTGSRQVSVALTSNDTSDPNGSVLGASTSKGNQPQDKGGSTSISIDMVALVAVVGALTLLVALGSLALRRRFVTA